MNKRRSLPTCTTRYERLYYSPSTMNIQNTYYLIFPISELQSNGEKSCTERKLMFCRMSGKVFIPVHLVKLKLLIEPSNESF